MPAVGKFKLSVFWFAFLTLCVYTNLVEAWRDSRAICNTDMGLQWIDLEKSLCCYGIHDKIDNHGRHLECCQLNKTNANGDIIPTKYVVYDPQRKLCCGEKVYALPKHLHNYQHPECCGGVALVDKIKEICCKDSIYESSQYYCYRGNSKEFPVGLHEQVCEKWAKDGTVLWKIHTSKKNWECCGQELHNENNQTHFCYEDKVWHQRAIVSECGDTLFDKTEAACCNNTYLIPVPKFGKTNATYIGIKPDYVCFDGKLVDQDLEGIREYGNKKYVVPNHFTPCGSTYYDPDNKRTQVHCCKGVVCHTALDKKVRCCGKEIIDTEEYICCNDTKIPVTSTLRCCNGKEISFEGNGGRTYRTTYDGPRTECDPNSSLWHFVPVPFNKGHNIECCSRTLINVSSDICCMTQASSFTVLKKHHPSHTSCCKSRETGEIQTYNKYEKVCERGDVRDKVHEEPTSPPTSSPRPQQRPSACPFCSQNVDKTACSKKNVFRFFLYEQYLTATGTTFDGVILQPFELKNGDAINGEKIKIQTHNLCKCFRMKNNFYLFTNRKIKSSKRDRYTVQLTANDVLITEDDQALAKCLTYQQTYGG